MSDTRLHLLNLSPHILGITDVEGRLTYVNPTWQSILGFTSEDLVAQHYSTYVHPQDKDATMAKVQKATQEKTCVTFENRYQTKAGDYCRIAWNVSTSTEKNQTYIIGEKLSTEKQNQLAAQQVVRHREIASEATKLAKKMKDNFLAVISHELRSPLYPILGWTQLLRRGDLDAKKTALAVEAIERNAKLQLKLVEDLIDVAQLSRGQVRLGKTVVSLNKVLTAALGNSWPTAQEKGVKIKKIALSEENRVFGDQRRLQQIISILLSNAITFTPEDSEITVTVGNEETYAYIKVADKGVGISPAFLPHVFDQFQQADYSKTRQVGGLGAGLTIAQQLVEMHNGSISVESPGLGKGATFTVRIPLA